LEVWKQIHANGAIGSAQTLDPPNRSSRRS
jgi:hypothetical protein